MGQTDRGGLIHQSSSQLPRHFKISHESGIGQFKWKKQDCFPVAAISLAISRLEFVLTWRSTKKFTGWGKLTNPAQIRVAIWVILIQIKKLRVTNWVKFGPNLG